MDIKNNITAGYQFIARRQSTVDIFKAFTLSLESINEKTQKFWNDINELIPSKDGYNEIAYNKIVALLNGKEHFIKFKEVAIYKDNGNLMKGNQIMFKTSDPALDDKSVFNDFVDILTLVLGRLVAKATNDKSFIISYGYNYNDDRDKDGWLQFYTNDNHFIFHDKHQYTEGVGGKVTVIRNGISDKHINEEICNCIDKLIDTIKEDFDMELDFTSPSELDYKLSKEEKDKLSKTEAYKKLQELLPRFSLVA